MKIHDIDILRKEGETGNLYDLTANTFVFFSSMFFEHTVLPEEDMRIDLVSFNLYGSVDFTDVILNVNQIINPLNIRAGDVLVIPEKGSIDNFRIVPPIPALLRPSIVNVNRANIKDPRRLEFIENNYQLPASILQIEQSPIQINRDNISISPIR